MKHISILVPLGDAALGCIEGPYTFFTKTNDFLVRSGKPALFNVHLVALTKKVQVYDHYFTVCSNMVLEEVQKTDLIIIPAVNGEMKKVISLNKDFFPWIRKQYKDGAEVASLCLGSFLLASAGLLKNKACVTHWSAANEFITMFPDVKLESDKIITDVHGIYTSAGGNSFWNLLLHLIEKYTSREIAIQCSKYFEIEIDRNNQSSFTIFKGRRDHHDEPIKKAQLFIEKNFQTKITIDQLSILMAIGRRTLERRFKKATYCTILEYIHKVKIEAAKKSFELGRKNVDDIMQEVGYSDTKAFRTIFKKTTGLSPIEYRDKFNKSTPL